MNEFLANVLCFMVGILVGFVIQWYIHKGGPE